MKKVVLILQARMGSTRLPGKSMMDLAGAPLIARIIERVKRCNLIDAIVLATPDSKENLVLGEVAKSYGIGLYCGSEDDLVNRYHEAALQSGADVVVRIPADNATPEPAEIDRVVKHHLTLNKIGFTSNLAEIYNSGYPDGIGAEVFDFALLSEIQKRTLDSQKREHVHLNFFNYQTQRPADDQWCPVRTIPCPAEFKRPDIVLDINTKEQYDFIRELYDYLYPKNPNFNIIDIIRWYDNVYKK